MPRWPSCGSPISTREGAEYHVRCFRIEGDIEFGGGGDVAHFEIGAAHHDDFSDAVGDLGLFHEGHADIGQRPEGAQGDGAGF